MYKLRTPDKISILIADDDADDRELIKAAFEEHGADLQLNFVENGEELMHYLRRKGPYADEVTYPFPKLILLDLNMPKKDGREALREIKTDKELKALPVLILTTSTEQKDINKSYELGVNSFIIKPVTFTLLVEFTRTIITYWTGIAQLPYITV